MPSLNLDEDNLNGGKKGSKKKGVVAPENGAKKKDNSDDDGDLSDGVDKKKDSESHRAF